MASHSPLRFSLVCLLIFYSVRCVKGWHGFNIYRFHCWSLAASEANYIPLDDEKCQDAFKMEWVVPPPVEVRAQDSFNLTYSLEVQEWFYIWAVDDGYFDGVGTLNLTTAASAKAWCETAECPESGLPKKTDCCIYHVNIHSCPKEEGSFCGPWWKHDGSTYSHSPVIVGPVDQGNWTSIMPGVFQDGLTDLIAHFKIANMQMALQTSINVHPRTVNVTIGTTECTATEVGSSGKGCADYVTNSECNTTLVPKVCVCSDGYEASGNNTACNAETVTIGTTECTATEVGSSGQGCADYVTNSECNNAADPAVCVCSVGYEANGNNTACSAVNVTIGTTVCTASEVGSSGQGCADYVTNSTCDTTADPAVCVCAVGYEASADNTACNAAETVKTQYLLVAAFMFLTSYMV